VYPPRCDILSDTSLYLDKPMLLQKNTGQILAHSPQLFINIFSPSFTYNIIIIFKGQLFEPIRMAIFV